MLIFKFDEIREQPVIITVNNISKKLTINPDVHKNEKGNKWLGFHFVASFLNEPKVSLCLLSSRYLPKSNYFMSKSMISENTS